MRELIREGVRGCERVREGARGCERVREGALIIARAVNRIITVSRLFITQP